MANGYIRQSAGQIVTGNTIQASDFNNEYNQLQSFADGTIGHDHSGGVGLGPQLSLTTAVTGLLPGINGGTGVNNGIKTITLGGNLATSGAFTTTLTVTGNSTVTLPTSGTLVSSANNLSVFAATTSAQLAGIISDETGTGNLVFANTPTLVTPNIGIATATTINKVTLTAPATGSTLTIADGKTLTASNTLTFTGTDASSIALGTGGTVVYTSVTSLASLTSAASLATVGTITSGVWSGTAILASKIATGTSGASIPLLNGNNTWSGTQTFNSGDAIHAGASSGTTILNATAVASGTLTLPAATDTLIGKATTDTLTNKTFDTAGTGNVLKIAGTTITAISGNTAKVATTTGALTSGHIATFDASGNIQDGGTAVSSSVFKKQIITATGAFTFTTPLTSTTSTVYKVTLTGGGGGGAGGTPGQGGSGGETIIKWVTGLAANTGYTGSVGTAGSGGTAGNSGTDGANTTFTDATPTTYTANHGVGGSSAVANGPVGGTSGNGDLNIPGGQAGPGVSGTLNSGGSGGSSFWGQGAPANTTVSASAGSAANIYGGGGSGGSGSATGGNGMSGIAVFEWIL